MTRVLVADDEEQMIHVISFILETEGFEVDTVSDGVAALERLRAAPYDLAVLDVMMPRLDGIEVCRRIREEIDIPVLLLTARSERDDVLTGLESGADDYLSKPFHPRELALRANAILRRRARTAVQASIQVHDLTIDLERRRASRGDVVLVLSALEWKIIGLLAEQPGAIVTWQNLLEEGWSVDQWSGDREMVKAAVYRLRMRLHDDAAHPRYIETIRGVGYRLMLGSP